MRLRLRIERNELPAVNVLWTIEPTALKQTVAQFLQRVDERVPLEGETWGFEDYAVTVGGYEAFHYSEVGECFQNEDEVVIKPLQFVDQRARTLTGRDQITQDGRHLLDGIPFGKPCLKRPRRPEVRIPPRKRQRVEEIENGGGEDEEQGAMVRFEELEDDEEDEEDDVDFEMEDDEEEESEEDEDDDIPTNRRRSRRQALIDDEAEESEEDEEDEKPMNRRRTRRQALIDDKAEDEDEDDEDDSSSDDDSDSDSDSSDEDSSDDSSDTSSSDSDASSEEEWNGIETSPRKPTSAPLTNGHTEPAQSTDSLPEIPAELVFQSAPFEGAERTKMRNARRRDQRKLKYLKETGKLDSGATMDDLRRLEDGGTRVLEQNDKNETQAEEMEGERLRLLEQIASGGVEIASEKKKGKSSAKTVASHAPIITKPALTNGNHADEDEAPDEETSLPPAVNINGTAEQESEPPADAMHAERRARINLAGANRLVFGSLGVKTPKTQADKDALQKKLSTRVSRNVPAKEVEPAEPEAQEDEDPESWRDKIELSAVECCDEGVELAAPPFPFQQRWDPQYQYGKKRKRPAANTTKRRKGRKTADGANGGYVETYDKYNTDGGGDALDYDDPEDEYEDDSYWEEGALLDDEADESGEQPIDDGFPVVPDDIAALPGIAEADARDGDFVIYKELVCTAATNWTPTTVNRTVKLDGKAGEAGWKVVFAARDKRPKKFDADGNRVYAKFEMEGLSDDEDEAEKTLQWAQMQEPKLLKRAASE